MGNHRFRLSDMMPNAWFQKLNTKNCNVSSNKNLHASSYSSLSLSQSLSSNSSVSSPSQLDKPPPPPPLSDQRKSYYFTRPEEPPRRSSRRRRSTRRRTRPHDAHPPLVSSSISAGCSCRSTIESVCTKPPPQEDDEGDRSLTPDDAFENMIPSCNCTTAAIDGKPIDASRASHFDRRDLPPIITKKQQPVRRFSGNPLKSSSSSSSSPGVKLRTNTPRIGSRRGRRSESFAVVKSSRDPGRDFRDSMVEMIVENNLRGTADLEELLACYLSLNTDEYHDLIIAVFKQIWFDLNRFRPN